MTRPMEGNVMDPLYKDLQHNIELLSRGVDSLQTDIGSIKTDVGKMREALVMLALQKQEIDHIKDNVGKLQKSDEHQWKSIREIQIECVSRKSKTEALDHVLLQKSKIQTEEKKEKEEGPGETTDQWWHRLWYGAVTHGLWIVISVLATLLLTSWFRGRGGG